MITDWDKLVDSLRVEVQEYGELLNLFDQQQGTILRREPEEVLAVNEMIEIQIQKINRCRTKRERLVKACAVSESQSEDMTLRDLLPSFLAPVRPLIEALLDEVNSLVGRAGRRARQNQLLLSRSIEVSQQILRRLNPAGITTTYSPTGQVMVATSERSQHYIARS